MYDVKCKGMHVKKNVTVYCVFQLCEASWNNIIFVIFPCVFKENATTAMVKWLIVTLFSM